MKSLPFISSLDFMFAFSTEMFPVLRNPFLLLVDLAPLLLLRTAFLIILRSAPRTPQESSQRASVALLSRFCRFFSARRSFVALTLMSLLFAQFGLQGSPSLLVQLS